MCPGRVFSFFKFDFTSLAVLSSGNTSSGTRNIPGFIGLCFRRHPVAIDKETNHVCGLQIFDQRE